MALLRNYEGYLQADDYSGYVAPAFMLRRPLPPEETGGIAVC